MSYTASDVHFRLTNLRNGAAAATPETVAASDLGVNTGYGSAMLSISERGEARLLLPVAAGTRLPRVKDLPVLEIGATHLSDGAVSRPYLTVSCLHPSLDRAFADLVLAVLSRVRDGQSASVALKSAIEQLRSLFSGSPEEVAGVEKVQGLVAELVVLLRLVNRDPRAVELWRGPEDDQHDFRGGVHAIEVKSTRQKSGAVTISSIGQLDIPLNGTLELWRVVLHRTVNGALSVGSVVREIEEVAGPSPLLRKGLEVLGCPDPGATSWNRATFNLEALDAYRIAEGFPRIVAGTFGAAGPPAGVTGIVYSVDLAQAQAFALTSDEMEASERRITECLTN